MIKSTKWFEIQNQNSYSIYLARSLKGVTSVTLFNFLLKLSIQRDYEPFVVDVIRGKIRNGYNPNFCIETMTGLNFDEYLEAIKHICYPINEYDNIETIPIFGLNGELINSNYLYGIDKTKKSLKGKRTIYPNKELINNYMENLCSGDWVGNIKFTNETIR